MKFLVATILCLSLAACSHDSSDNNKKGGDNDPNKPQNPAVNETDYGVCGNYTPDNANIEGSWKMLSSQGDFDFLLVMTFKNNMVTVSNECRLSSRSLVAQARSFARYGNGELEIFSHDEKTASINEADFKMTCTSAVDPAKAHYSFQGRCLVIQAGNESVKLVPAQ